MKEKITHIAQTLRPCLGWLGLGVGLTFLVDGISLLAPVFIGHLVDVFLSSTDLKDVQHTDYLFWIGMIAVVTLVNFGLIHAGTLISLKKYIFHIGRFFQIDAMRRVSKFSVGQLQDKNSGEIQSIIQRGVAGLENLIQLMIFNFIPSVSYLLAVMIGLFFVSWEVNIILLVFVAFTFAFLFRETKKFDVIFGKQQKQWQEIDTQATEFLRNLVLVKLTAAEDATIRGYESDRLGIEGEAREGWVSYNVRMLIMHGVYVLSLVAILGLSAFLVVQGKYSPGSFIVIYSWSISVMMKVRLLRREFRNISKALPSINKFYELIMEKPKIQDFGLVQHIAYGSISFENLSYKTPLGKILLEKINFSVKPGESIGIIGHSGAGKSTLVNMILRSNDPTSGGIYIDNIPLREYSESYRRDIAYVEQSPYLFDQSIRYNVCFGLENVPDEDVWQVLKKVRLDNEFRSSPEGLGTIIGERGIRLSGGEAQRLVIARALIRKPKLLIFDEATSALDDITQEALQDAIEEVRDGITTLIIAHRLSAVRYCDKILELEEGKIKNFGNRDDILGDFLKIA